MILQDIFLLTHACKLVVNDSDSLCVLAKQSKELLKKKTSCHVIIHKRGQSYFKCFWWWWCHWGCVWCLCLWHWWTQLRVRASVVLWAWKSEKERAISTFGLLPCGCFIFWRQMCGAQGNKLELLQNYLNSFLFAALLEISGYSMYFPLLSLLYSPFSGWFHFAPNRCIFTVFGVTKSHSVWWQFMVILNHQFAQLHWVGKSNNCFLHWGGELSPPFWCSAKVC